MVQLDVDSVVRNDRRGRATELDEALGQRIRRLRVLRKMTQADLAKALKMTFQQVQKYESGRNRLPLRALFLIANALGTSVPLLTHGLDAYLGMSQRPGHEDRSSAALMEEAQRLAEGLEMMRLYNELEAAEAREMLRALAMMFRTIPGGAAFAPLANQRVVPARTADRSGQHHYAMAE